MVKKFGRGFNLETEEGEDPKVKKDTDVSGNDTSQGVKMGEWGPWQTDPNDPKREVRYRKGESKSDSKPQYRIKAAISGGKAGAGYDKTMITALEAGKTYEELAAAGHGTVAGLKARFEGKFNPPESETVEISEEQERFKEDPPDTPDTPDDTPDDTPEKKPCPPGFARTETRGCVKMPKNKRGSKKIKSTSIKIKKDKPKSNCYKGQCFNF